MNHHRVLSTTLVVVVAILVATALPAQAAATGVASIHTTDTDFNNAATLSNVVVDGTGTSASVDLDTQSFSYNVVSDSGDGSTDTTAGFVGDTGNDNARSAELKTVPDFTGEVDTVTLDIGSTSLGSDYGFTVDVYAVQEDPDGTTGEGTLIKSGWDPDFSSGSQSFVLDTNFVVQSGETWTLEFVTQSTDNDGNGDWISIKTDNSFTSNWIWNNVNGFQNEGGDVTLDGDSSYDTGTYISQNHSADNVEKAFVDLSLTDANATVTWQYWTGSSWTTQDQTTYTTSGNKTVTWPEQGTSKWRVNVTYEATTDGVVTASVEDEGVLFNATAPTVNNSSASPSGGTKIDSSTPKLQIDVNDTDFETSQGDEVTVEFKVKEPGTNSFTSVGTDTITSNGTASYDYSASDGGDYDWKADPVTDDYGETTTSQTFSFTTPSNVTIRNESDASEIITGADITITFYSTDGTTIVEKTDTDDDGNVSLSGLPNENFVAVIEADGWYTRRVYIDSLFNQQDIYLLNETAFPNAIDTDFVYEDRTGEFPSDTTALMIERAVDPDNDGNFTWQTVAGDFWGAAGEFPFTGEPNERYRLIILNTNTNTERNLGTHIPTADGTKNVVVGQLEWPSRNATGRWFDATLDGTSIPVVYEDPDENTTEVRIQVYEQGNTSNEVYDQNFTSSPYGTLETSVTLTSSQAEKNWVVEYTAETTDDGTVTGQVVVGGNAFSLPIDSWLLGTFAWIFFTFSACLYGPRTAVLGAWTMVLLAGGLMIFQWVQIPTASFVAGTLVAAGGTWYREALP